MLFPSAWLMRTSLQYANDFIFSILIMFNIEHAFSRVNSRKFFDMKSNISSEYMDKKVVR